jgi:Fe2+ or Zn2+ uptake regulation protein
VKKTELTKVVEAAKTETRTALQTVYNTLNKGQQQKLLKDEQVKALFDLYGVAY